jgi:type II secretory pathway component PulF
MMPEAGSLSSPEYQKSAVRKKDLLDLIRAVPAWISAWLQLAAISRRETAQLFNQLGVMLEAGLSLEKGLEILAAQTSKAYLNTALHDILQNIRSGLPLHQALQAQHRLFPALAAQMVMVGESGGVLTEMLYRIYAYMENQSELQKRLLTALAYPGIVFLFAVAAVLGISFFIIPMFSELYSGAGVPLPLVTTLVMCGADFIRDYGLLALVLSVSALYLLLRACRRPPFALAVQRRLFSMPVVGRLLKDLALMHITETAAVLIKVGVPALTALETARDTSTNPYVQNIVEQTCLQMQDGKSIAWSLAEYGRFEEMYIRMIAAGEESGHLAEMLEALNGHLRKQLLNRLDGLIVLLEPALILMVALLVGITVIATLMPMYGLMDLAGGL